MKDFRLFTRWSEDIIYILLTILILVPFDVNPVTGSILSWGIAMVHACWLRHSYEKQVHGNDVPDDNLTVFSLTVTWVILAVSWSIISHNWWFLVLLLYPYISWILTVFIANLIPQK